MSGYASDKDFLAVAQARENSKAFLQVKRAQWIGELMDEVPQTGLLAGLPAVWNGVALYRQDDIIEELKVVELKAVGEELGESDSTEVKGVKKETVVMTENDKKINTEQNGAIIIPAAAAVSEDELILMKSNLGGLQMHLPRNAHTSFSLTFNTPKAGLYELNARVVTVHWKQKLLLQANDVKNSVVLDLPYTLGEWKNSSSIKLQLNEGNNKINFSRTGDNIKGITIRDFNLKPLN